MELDYRAVEGLLKAGSVQELSRVVDALMQSYGAAHWIYAIERSRADTDGNGWHLMGGYPEAWLSHYFGHGYAAVDPAIAHAKSRVGPLEWPDYQAIQRDAEQLKDPAKRLFVEAKEFGLAGGITVPLNGFGVRCGLMSASFERRKDAIEARRSMGDLFLLCNLVHEVGHLLVGGNDLNPELSPFELECLKLAVSGKNSDEIAARMNRKKRTITAVFSKIVQRLNVRSRQAAVAAAVARGIVKPDL